MKIQQIISFLTGIFTFCCVILFFSCKEKEYFTGDDNKNEPSTSVEEDLQFILVTDYVKDSQTFLLSNGIALNVLEDSVGNGYYLYADSLDFNTGEWSEEKSIAVWCDSDYRPICATNSQNDKIQFFYSDEHTFSLKITDRNNQTKEYTNLPLPASSRNMQSRVSTGGVDIAGLNYGLGVLDLAMSTAMEDKVGIVSGLISMILPELVPEGIPSDFVSLGLASVSAYFFKGMTSYVGLALSYAQLLSDIRYWVVRQEIGDITPTISLLTLKDRHSVYVGFHLYGTGFSSNTKDFPYYHIKYWQEIDGVKVGQTYKTDFKKAEEGTWTELVSDLYSGTYAFQVFVYPSSYSHSDFLMDVYSFKSNIMRIEVLPLYLSEIEQEDITFASGEATSSMKVSIGTLSESDKAALVQYSDYGIFAKRKKQNPELHSIKGKENTPLQIGINIPKKDFTIDYNTYTATTNSVTLGAYVVSKDGTQSLYDEQNVKIIYDKKPYIKFKDLVQGEVKFYFSDEYNELCMTTTCEYWEEISGALFMDATFDYNGPDCNPPGKLDFTINTSPADGTFYNKRLLDGPTSNGIYYNNTDWMGFTINGQDFMSDNYLERNWTTGEVHIR